VTPPDRVRLCCFGVVRLEGVTDAPHVSPLQLLILCFVKLEGVRSRRELAALFWAHLHGQFTRKAERKDLANLGVMRAVLKRELHLNLEELDDLDCDAVNCKHAFESGDFETALRLLRGGAFLEQLEARSRLTLGAELDAWVTRQRAMFEDMRRSALVQLAERRVREGALEDARGLALEAGQVMAAGSDPAQLPRFRQLCAKLGLPLPAHWREALTASFEDLRFRLSDDALKLYLVLSLQPQPNFVAASRVVELGTRAATACLEELIGAKLVDATGQLLVDVASDHLEAHPTERLRLLNALREHTPADSALELYRAIFATTQSFGGIGYWERARSVYHAHASRLLHAQDFNAACDVLTEWRRAEGMNAQMPDPENRFLLAYALERLKRYPEGLETLEGVQETPEVLAIKSALLLRNAPVETARVAAETVLATRADPVPSDWARAIALNTLGQIAYEQNLWLEAEVLFDQAHVTWALARHPQRELGALMNRAVVLERLQRIPEARRVYDDVLVKAGDDPMGVKALVNLGYMYERLEDWVQAHGFYARAQQRCRDNPLLGNDAALRANVLNNLGYAEFKLGRDDDARSSLTEAMSVSVQAGQRFWLALALGNLALVERSIGKFEMALGLFQELGVPNYLEQYTALYQSMLEKLLFEARDGGQAEQSAFYERKLEGLRAETSSGVR
jgi:tetratricopeptide (TPR) repeat protein